MDLSSRDKVWTGFDPLMLDPRAHSELLSSNVAAYPNSIDLARMSVNECPICETTLTRATLQLRSDDEASTLVLSCPIHGVHYRLVAVYREVTSNSHAIQAVVPSRSSQVPKPWTLNQDKSCAGLLRDTKYSNLLRILFF